MGAWIEIVDMSVRDIKKKVAPLVGAWIEIYPLRRDLSQPIVAPLVGAWIEIKKGKLKEYVSLPSLPSWERGLKFWRQALSNFLKVSLPSWGRGLKLRGHSQWRRVLRRSPRGSVD